MVTTTRQTVSGLRELGQALQGLGTEMQRRIARRTTNAGAQVVKEAVIERALQQPTLADKPFEHEGVVYQPGEIARNVIVARVKQPETTSEHVVAVRSNAKNGYIGRIASLNEFGTIKMSPQPFMRPGFESSKGAAVNEMVRELDKSIQSAAKRLRAKAK